MQPIVFNNKMLQDIFFHDKTFFLENRMDIETKIKATMQRKEKYI